MRVRTGCVCELAQLERGHGTRGGGVAHVCRVAQALGWGMDGLVEDTVHR